MDEPLSFVLIFFLLDPLPSDHSALSVNEYPLLPVLMVSVRIFSTKNSANLFCKKNPVRPVRL
jgi:hypothetical protein